MTKLRKNNSAKSGKGGTQQSRRIRVKSSMAIPKRIDQAGLAYARLLADPCSAPLVHPTYSGTEAGYLVRAESFATFGTGGTETSGAIGWTPGSIGAEGNELVRIVAASASAATQVDQVTGVPGKAFLQANASQYRCVAACLKVSFPGAESARAGRIHFGHTSGGYFKYAAATTYTVDQLAAGVPHYMRTPAEEIEIVWKPNDADQLFRDPAGPTAAQDMERRAQILVAWAGLPAGVGITFRWTAVYEWQPKSANAGTGVGLSVPYLSKSPSGSSLDDVANYLIERGFKFVRYAGREVGASMASGAMRAISSTFGLIPAVPRTRTLLAM